jgi:hypothetical protein
MRLLAGLITVALFAAAPVLNAQDPVYTWVDGNGVRHYAQTPPEGVKYETRGIRDRSVGTETTRPPAAPARTTEEVIACDRARVALQQLSGPALVEMDKDGDGTPEPLTPEEKAQQRRLSEQAVAAYCPREGEGAPEASPQE